MIVILVSSSFCAGSFSWHHYSEGHPSYPAGFVFTVITLSWTVHTSPSICPVKVLLRMQMLPCWGPPKMHCFSLLKNFWELEIQASPWIFQCWYVMYASVHTLATHSLSFARSESTLAKMTHVVGWPSICVTSLISQSAIFHGLHRFSPKLALLLYLVFYLQSLPPANPPSTPKMG